MKRTIVVLALALTAVRIAAAQQPDASSPTRGIEDDESGEPAEEATADSKASEGGAAAERAHEKAVEGQRAQQLKRKGDALSRNRRYAEALIAYHEAYEIGHNPAVLYNMGRALESLGRYAEALHVFRQFEREAPQELLDRVSGLPTLLNELEGRVTELTIETNVKGARVVLRNEVVGTTPILRQMVNEGPATVEVVLDGYYPLRRELDLEGGGKERLEFVLQSRDTSGVLVIKSSVAGASTSVDDRPRGQTPSEIVLQAGEHEVLVSHDGYRDARTTVVLKPGEHREITLVLRRPAVRRWWFWASVAGTAAAATGAAIALAVERPGSDGSFSPGRVGAPLVRF